MRAKPLSSLNNIRVRLQEIAKSISSYEKLKEGQVKGASQPSK